MKVIGEITWLMGKEEIFTAEEITKKEIGLITSEKGAHKCENKYLFNKNEY